MIFNMIHPKGYLPPPDFYHTGGEDVPPLLVALRRLPISYEHILQWFARSNNHVFLLRTRKGLGRLNRFTSSELAVVTSVTFVLL